MPHSKGFRSFLRENKYICTRIIATYVKYTIIVSKLEDSTPTSDWSNTITENSFNYSKHMNASPWAYVMHNLLKIYVELTANDLLIRL